MWTQTSFTPPPEGKVVETKISDQHGDRNVQKLIRKGNLYFHTDMSIYVYYTPDFWRFVTDK